MQRRAFLRSACMACAGSVLGPLVISLTGCGTLPLVQAQRDTDGLSFPLDAFGEQQQVILRHPRLTYDLLVSKRPDGGYTALYMRCTHEDQPLTATPQGLHCASHGSRFALDGSVVTGPAVKPLLTFPVVRNGDRLTIPTQNN